MILLSQFPYHLSLQRTLTPYLVQHSRNRIEKTAFQNKKLIIPRRDSIGPISIQMVYLLNRTRAVHFTNTLTITN